MGDEELGSGRGRYRCQFNQGVLCPPVGRRCDRCGWNPEVSQKRGEEARKRRKNRK